MQLEASFRLSALFSSHVWQRVEHVFRKFICILSFPHRQELEAVEEQWHSETSELAALVSRLQEENRRISKQAESPKHNDANSASNELNKTDATANWLNASDFQKMQRLRGQMEKQRDDLKCRDQEIEEKNNDIENVRVFKSCKLFIAISPVEMLYIHFFQTFQLTIQLDRLRSSSRECRKRQKVLQTQVRSLIDERTDFLVQLQDQNREITALRKGLGIATKDRDHGHDDDADANRPRFSTAELKDLLIERDNLKAKIQGLEEELRQFKPIESIAPTSADIEEDEEEPG